MLQINALVQGEESALPTFSQTQAFYIQKAKNHVINSLAIYLQMVYCNTCK